MEIVIITGLSGAGKSQALHTLEDEGFFCIDNLPVNLLSDMVHTLLAEGQITKVAFGVDSRSIGIERLQFVQEALRTEGHRVYTVFLTANDDTLIRRFSETRRNHPLSRLGFVEEGIGIERMMMETIEQTADQVIDTSQMKPAKLQKTLLSLLDGEQLPFVLLISSFGYKYGLPESTDWVLDLRFLPNPYWIEELRPLTGLDEAVKDYIFSFPQANEFLANLDRLICPLIPSYQEEGKERLTISLGCTGGQHRSTCMAEALADRLRVHGFSLGVRHRDLYRGRENSNGTSKNTTN